jgi:signal transduction protein with GAF and PtsI domain
MSGNRGAQWLSRAIGVGGAGLEVQASRRLLSIAVDAIQAQEGSLLILDEEINELRFVATAGNSASEAALIGQRVPLGKGVTGLAAVTRGVQIGSPTYVDIHQTKRLAAGPEAIVAAPIVASERLLGVMTGVTFEVGRRFGTDEASVYGEYAAVMAALLEQGRRLNAAAGLESGAETAMSGVAAIEREIVDRLARIVGDHPDVLGAVARLFEALESVIHARTRHRRPHAPPGRG